ncbi:J domain-containing protein [Mycolicibacterium tusciae]|uniref:J domain-containing protein n=1 Tax=Mycolicibacterium tusciae TaxID=75922 RepID=UPI00024A4F46|nr:DnaJ domain-containing protein [Mycolicibacterium tusciae]
MIEDHNPYAVLGVTPVATAAEINHAFRAKLRDVHPDTRRPAAGGVAGDTQLRGLIAAYHLLRDPQDRARYDHNARIAAATSARQPHQRPSPSFSFDVAAVSVGPQIIPVTQPRRQAPARCPLWAGPVRRHRDHQGFG